MEHLAKNSFLSFSFVISSIYGIPSSVFCFIETHSLFSLITSIILSLLFIIVMTLKAVGQYYDTCHKRWTYDQDMETPPPDKPKKFSLFNLKKNKKSKF